MTNTSSVNLHAEHRKISEGITIFTAVKNRSGSLTEALETWLSHPNINEIIIVDWDSDESIEPLIRQFNDERIHLAIVENQPKWILSFAFNLAARLTSRTKLLKLDADVKLLPGFFEKHPLLPGRFYCGNWRNRRNDNELHLNGVVFLHRADFFSVNGYNEFIKFYGWDDSDLYRRLEAAGLERHDLDNDTLYHMPHEERTRYQEKPLHFAANPDGEWASLATLVNRHLCQTFGIWSSTSKMLEFSVTEHSGHMQRLKQRGPDTNTVTPEMLTECENVAMKDRLQIYGAGLSDELMNMLTRDELIELYNLYFKVNQDQAAAHLFSVIRKSDRLSRSGPDDKNH